MRYATHEERLQRTAKDTTHGLAHVGHAIWLAAHGDKYFPGAPVGYGEGYGVGVVRFDSFLRIANHEVRS